MTESKKMGRPKLPKNKAKDSVFTLRLSEEERTSLEQAAKSEGLTPSEFARIVLQKASTRIKRIT